MVRTLNKMAYNGLGMHLTSCVLGTNTRYASDEQLPLTNRTWNKVITVLHGLGPVAEKTTDWNYVLNDGFNLPRQLTDGNGAIILSARYSPWGKMMDVSGLENFDMSYISALADFATGLIYVGNGQYFDPETGRFLTRGVNPNSPNPYVPWDPMMTILGPLGLVSANYARKRIKRVAAVGFLALFLEACETILILIALGLILVAFGIVSCSSSNKPDDVNTPPGQNGDDGGTVTPPTETQPPTPTPTPTPPPPCCNWLPDEFLITHYTIPLETDPFFQGCDNCYPANIPMWDNGQIVNRVHNNAFIYGVPDPGSVSGYNWDVYQEGTGYTADGKYISQDFNHETEDHRAVFVYEKGGACKPYGYEIETWKTVAADLDYYNCGDKFKIEKYGDTIFTVVDDGTELGQFHFDIFVGPMTKAEFDVKFADPGSTYFYSKVAKIE